LRLYFKKKPHAINSNNANKNINNTSNNNNNSNKNINSTNNNNNSGTLKRNDSDASSKKSVDDELLEIINDFKNNVFTIQEVEELVSTWKNRNDVRKSFKEKQEQLQKMREEYEKIQLIMKERLKRPSPFERMKRIFSRKQQQEKPVMIMSLPINLTGSAQHFSTLPNSNHRPTSTLSLHSASSSNSSSGRMSTSSQASVGDRDSGTHSDHEDRRNTSSNFKIGQAGSLMDNYMIPPTPRPILTPLSTPVDDEKGSLLSFSMSNGSTPTAEHYILFPSNIPVFQSIAHPQTPTNGTGSSSFSTFKGNNKN
jgi:hypothetical protein